MNVLKRINKLRMDRGWSVYRLSIESGLPQSTIINMFNRETLPSITTLENICKAFGITMAEFFDESTDLDEALLKEDTLLCSKKEFVALYEKLLPATRLAVFHLMQELSENQK